MTYAAVQFAALTGSVGGIVIGALANQALTFRRNYRQLPAAEGPRTGVELSPAAKRALRRAAGGREPPRAKAGEGASALVDREPRPRHMVFIGDSLIAGVGCSVELASGPALPRCIAKALAHKLNRSIQWRALAVDGGDVEELHQELLPKLKDAMGELQADDRQRAKKRGQGGVDMVVLMCGLNDWKRAPMEPFLRSPAHFQRDLKRLCDAIHKIVGHRTPIVLPGLPLKWSLAFPQPLRAILVQVSRLWDARKAALAAESACISFVPAPRYEGGGLPLSKLLAPDGVHPNEKGYEIWAEHISAQVLPHFTSDPQQRARL